jgi:hypothetical protein
MTLSIKFASWARDVARYAAIFAADAGTDALYYDDRYTDEMADLCVNVALEAIMRRDAAQAAGKDFYACAFVEAAANALNQCHAATLEQLFDAGQRESDSIAGKGE